MNAPQTLWIDWNDQEDTMPTMVSAMTERSQNAHWFQRVDYAPAARIAALEAERDALNRVISGQGAEILRLRQERADMEARAALDAGQ